MSSWGLPLPEEVLEFEAALAVSVPTLADDHSPVHPAHGSSAGLRRLGKHPVAAETDSDDKDLGGHE